MSLSPLPKTSVHVAYSDGKLVFFLLRIKKKMPLNKRNLLPYYLRIDIEDQGGKEHR